MMNQTVQGIKKFRGLIHIHTTFSYDGTVSLPDFVNMVKIRNYNFIVLTEHAEDFDDNKMQVLTDACRNASGEDFIVIPGLEFNISDQIHILGIGIKKYIKEKDPTELIRKIHEDDGLAILAHTAYYKKIFYAPLKDIDIIEIWNPRYGERLSPSINSIKICHEFRTMKKSYMASGGLDFHKREDLVPLYEVVFADRLTSEDILDSLRRGKFSTTRGLIEYPPLKGPTSFMATLIYLFAFVQFVPEISKKIMRRIYRIFR